MQIFSYLFFYWNYILFREWFQKNTKAMSRRISDIEVSSAASDHRNGSTLPQQHSVGRPKKESILKEVGHTIKETLFHDFPLRSFKDQSASKRFLLGLQTLFPIFDWGRQYNLNKFKSDFIAGVTIASLCIPQVTTSYPFLSTFWVPFVWSGTTQEWWSDHVNRAERIKRDLRFMWELFCIDVWQSSGFLGQDIAYAKLANLPPQYGLCEFSCLISRQ